jgi:hypothetical protein
MRILVAVMLVTTTARADVLVATSNDNGALFVDQITADKVAKVYSEAGKGVVAYAFSDAKTLWVVRKDGSGFSIGKVVDGKADAAQPLAKLKTVTPGNEVPTGFDATPALVTTKQGQVFVATCTGLDDKASGPLMHCKVLYRRVDDGSNTESTKRPAGIAAPVKPPVVKKPPADFTAKLEKIKVTGFGVFDAFSCKAKDGKHFEWPAADFMTKVVDCAKQKSQSDECLQVADHFQFTPLVTKVDWLASAPPLVRFEANGTSPVGEKLHEEHLIEGCTTEVENAQPLRDGLWLTDGKVRKPTGEVLGQLSGATPVIAP